MQIERKLMGVHILAVLPTAVWRSANPSQCSSGWFCFLNDKNDMRRIKKYRNQDKVIEEIAKLCLSNYLPVDGVDLSSSHL